MCQDKGAHLWVGPLVKTFGDEGQHGWGRVALEDDQVAGHTDLRIFCWVSQDRQQDGDHLDRHINGQQEKWYQLFQKTWSMSKLV